MRYSGKFGYSEQKEVAVGVWEDVITEVTRLGTVLQRTEAVRLEGSIHPSYRTTTSVSVLAHGAEIVNHSNLRYVTYAGVRWVPSSVVVEGPRITVFIGEEYNGPVADDS